MISNLARIKKAAAVVNAQSGNLAVGKKDAIVQACDEIVAGYFHEAFIVDAIQGGTAGKMTVLQLLPELIAELEKLESALGDKAEEFAGVIKMGRTQMQDAVPTTLGRTFQAYRSFVKRDIRHLLSAAEEMKSLNIGGTAIGNAINATPEYLENITAFVSDGSGDCFHAGG